MFSTKKLLGAALAMAALVSLTPTSMAIAGDYYGSGGGHHTHAHDPGDRHVRRHYPYAGRHLHWPFVRRHSHDEPVRVLRVHITPRPPLHTHQRIERRVVEFSHRHY